MSKERLSGTQKNEIKPLGIEKKTWLKAAGWVVGAMALVKFFSMVEIPAEWKLPPPSGK